MTERVYISGPMTGLPDDNYPAFFRAAGRLRELGYRPENPAELQRPFGPDTHWTYYMREAIRRLMLCDSILMLDGWGQSRGASMEHDIALKLYMRIYYGSASFGGALKQRSRRTA